jgi:hypothetical protein
MLIPTFDFRNNRNKGIIFLLLFLAISFNILRNSEQTTILAIILILLFIGIYASVYGISFEKELTLKEKSKAELDLDKAVSNRINKNDGSAMFDTYMVKSFPKTGLKYLRENENMLAIAENLLYLQVYDKSRYQDVLLLMDRLQKVYIYTLVGRYNCQHGLTLFMDIRELLREKLYSFYIVTPLKTKHMYGLDPHGELERSIKVFTSQTRRMIKVIENYARRECKAAYLDPTVPKAKDPSASSNTMP